MSISGAIEDFPLKDILQIISFSRKSGTLRIKSEAGPAHIVFKMGAIVHAQSPGPHADFGTLAVERGYASHDAVGRAMEIQRGEPPESRRPLGHILLSAGDLKSPSVQAVVHDQIALVLRELLQWTSGYFVFEVHKVASPDSFGLGFEEMALEHGLDVQRLLLEAMKFFDDRARARPADAAPPVQKAAPPSAPPVERRPIPRVVLFHEEGLFREILKRRLEAEGIPVDPCEDPEQALMMAEGQTSAGSSPMIVGELDAAEGDFSDWGTRLLEKVAGKEEHPPILLLAEPGAEGARERAFALGARQVLVKPERGEGTASQYIARIEEFAVDLAFAIKGQAAEEALLQQVASVHEGPSSLPSEFRELLAILRSEDAASLTLKLLEVIGKRFPRSILLHHKSGALTVKGAFGKSKRGAELFALLRGLELDLRQCPGFRSALELHAPRRLSIGPDVGQLPDLVGAPVSGECLAIPIVCNYRPVGLIYADTGDTGKPVGDLEIYRELCHRVAEILEEAVRRDKAGRGAGERPSAAIDPLASPIE